MCVRRPDGGSKPPVRTATKRAEGVGAPCASAFREKRPLLAEVPSVTSIHDFFVRCAATVRPLSRTQDSLTPAEVARALIAKRGALGSLAKAVEWVIFSLRNWGILQETATRYA